MSDLNRFGDQVWDRLFELLYACDESVPDEDVDAELQRAGIDVRATIRSVELMIEQARARAILAKASDTRASVMEQIRGIVAPVIEDLNDLRTGVRDFIDRVFTGNEQVAQYHKLEKAATPEDLKSLLDDLTKLAAMRQKENDSKTE